MDVLLGDVDLLNAGNDEGGSLAGAVLGACEDVAPGENDGNGLFLNRTGLLKALFEDTHEQLALKVVIFELVPLGGGDILKGERGKVVVGGAT